MTADNASPRDPAAYKRLEIESGKVHAHRSLDWYRAAHGVRSDIEVHTVLRHLAPTREMHVLDVGCGVGRISLTLAPQVRHVTAVDISPENIKVLNEHARTRQLANITGRASDMNDLAIGEQFDAAVAIQSVQHIPSAELRVDAVRRIHAALKRGGRFVTVNYRWGGAIDDEKEGTHSDGRYRFSFTPDELEQLLVAGGFTNVTVHGCVNSPNRLMRLAKRAPRLLAQADALVSFLPASKRMGEFLIATGVA